MSNRECKVQILKEAFMRFGINLCSWAAAVIQEPWRTLRKIKSAPAPSGAGNDRGDVPGWVLVVLMTAGLVTGIWTVAAPRFNLILRNSLDSMNAIR